MSTTSDPRPVAVSYRAYRVLLASYPRRFRQQYRQEMAIVFRDACREAYDRDGSLGLIAVWRHGLADLSLNAVKERTLALVDETSTQPCSRSCSICNTEIDAEWRQCRYCGSLLSLNTTHPTRAPNQNWDARLRALIDGARGWSSGI